MRFAAVRLGVAVFLLSLLPTPIYAVGNGTQLNFAVCGEGSGSSISIVTPLSDSVGNTPQVTLAGSVKNATQIDVMIDDQYSHTEAVNATDTEFSIMLQVVPGTHKITLVANDVCQIQSASDTIVITYEKKVAPSPGVTVPTDIGNGDGDGGVRIYAPAETQSPDPVPVLQPILDVGNDVGKFLIDSLDLQPNTQESPVTTGVRVLTAVTGIAAMMFGPVVAAWQGVRGAINMVVLKVAGVRNLMPAVPSRKLNLIIRTMGGVLFLISLTL